MRRVLVLVLFSGMIAGYGSAIAHALGYGGGHCSRAAPHADPAP